MGINSLIPPNLSSCNGCFEGSCRAGVGLKVDYNVCNVSAARDHEPYLTMFGHLKWLLTGYMCIENKIMRLKTERFVPNYNQSRGACHGLAMSSAPKIIRKLNLTTFLNLFCLSIFQNEAS